MGSNLKEGIDANLYLSLLEQMVAIKLCASLHYFSPLVTAKALSLVNHFRSKNLSVKNSKHLKYISELLSLLFISLPRLRNSNFDPQKIGFFPWPFFYLKSIFFCPKINKTFRLFTFSNLIPKGILSIEATRMKFIYSNETTKNNFSDPKCR